MRVRNQGGAVDEVGEGKPHGERGTSEDYS